MCVSRMKYADILNMVGLQKIGKRPSTVIRHILKYGSVTTEDLEKKYGYKHPPRAIRDVKELGIPIVKTSTKSSDGKTIAEYRIVTLEEIVQKGGRMPFPKDFKKEISTRSQCMICGIILAGRYLQIDHKVPFHILGDVVDREPSNFMLLCGTCNRTKSWSCEHCDNWNKKDIDVCKTCYWGNPEVHTHVATTNLRRIDIIWAGDEMEVYDWLVYSANNSHGDLRDYIKSSLKSLCDDEQSSRDTK